ncbi:hypothetical protein C8F01DRAFT_1130083 [Mycena amicta]|nr:hypothetical protein C8F01DRAFT_1130083 [Mycena amicta]
MTTPAAAVFNVAELCDTIAPSLLPSTWDLRSAALISHAFTAAAQRLLFRDVILNRGAFSVDHVSAMELDDEKGKSLSLASVLSGSSGHLGAYVRRIRLAFEEDVLRPLTLAMALPNLREVVLHRRRGGAITHEAISLAAALIAQPSVERVGLIYPIFSNPADIALLFANHSDKLTALSFVQLNILDRDNAPIPLEPAARVVVAVRKLHIDSHAQYDQAWLLHPTSPVDISRLEELSFGRVITPTVERVLQGARRTLTKLTIDAQHAINQDFTETPRLDMLAHFPKLEHLVITSTAKHLVDAATLLSALTTKLHSVSIVFDPGPGLSLGAPVSAGLTALGEVFAGWADPQRCCVNIVVPTSRVAKVREKVSAMEALAVYERAGGKLWVGPS